MDPLSDIFALLNVESALSARLEAGGDWAIRFSAYRHVKFGAVLAGSCWLSVDGIDQPLRLDAGDCYLLTNGQPYRIAGDLKTEATDGAIVFAQAVDGVARLGNGEGTTLIGGRFTFDEVNAKLLLDLLPPMIHIRSGSDPAAVLRSMLDLLARETATAQLGAALMADRLAHVLFIQALRAYVASEERPPVGWLGALADSKIGVVLRLMHGDVARKWTLPELADAVGMSRSSFSSRFKTLVGLAPLDYFLRWRMHLAGQALRSEDRTVSSVALELGYAFESAFSTAFKRVMGCAPKQYRMGQPPPAVVPVRRKSASLITLRSCTGDAILAGSRRESAQDALPHLLTRQRSSR
jgi:AraC-like DNA-binding protein